MGFLKTLLVSSSIAGFALAHPHAHNHKRGTVPITASVINSCTEPGVVALTFDDGPYIYTQTLVNELTAAGHRVTFFQNGNNWDLIYNYNDTIKSMIANGHQIGSHTWDHTDLTTLTAAEQTTEMTQLETAYMNILGYYPTYMRPPYFSYNNLVLQTMAGLGYKIIIGDIDTQDWAEDPLGDVALSIQWYEGNQTAGGTISLNHDVYEPTVDTFVPTIITYLASKNLKSVPVGECLGDDPTNWYRNTRNGWASSSSSSSHSSTTSSHSSTSTSHSATTTSSHSATTSTSHWSSSTSTSSAGHSSSTTWWPSTSTHAATTSSTAATPSGVVSPDWSCGGSKGYICPAGNCCSAYGWCGSSSDYCGTGCQSLFGTCTSSSSGGGSTSGGSGTIDTENGSCGGSSGYVCGSGQCCSKYGYCGTGSSYCGKGCQSAFGTCN